LKIWTDKRSSFAMGADAGLAAVLVLYFFAPEHHRFYPRCLFYMLTGAQCPGCGGLRAMHRLLHGDFAAAWRFNALVVLLLPMAGVWLVVRWVSPATAAQWRQAFLKPGFLWLVFAAGIVYAVLRNIPGL
jgi:hypothetical protein